MTVVPAPADVLVAAVGPWLDNAPSQEIGQFDTMNYTNNADSGAQVTFGVRGRSPTAQVVSELDTDVWIYRSGLSFFRGRITSIEQTWGPDGEDNLQITAVSYKRLLNARHVWTPLEFLNEYQEQIVWELIQHTQALPGGDMGIVAGVLADSIQRDRAYIPGDNIGKELHDLSGVIDGCWWDISPGLELDAHPWNDFAIHQTPAQLGVSVRGMTRSSGVSQFGNAVFVDGDSTTTTPVQADSATILTDPRGRWERAVGFPTVKLQETLVEKADGLLEEINSPLTQWSCQLDVGRFLLDADYEPGDFVEIVVPPDTAAPIGTPASLQWGQVMNTSLSLSADGEASASIEVLEIDGVPA